MLVALELDMSKLRKELKGGGGGNGKPEFYRPINVPKDIADMCGDIVAENKREYGSIPQLVEPILREAIEAIWKVKGQKAAKIRKLTEELRVRSQS
jgi:hypothetical protein